MTSAAMPNLARLLLVMLAVLTNAGAELADQPPAPFEFGPRPAQPVFDPTATLPAKDIAALSKELTALRTREGIDIIVVVLKTLDGAPAELVAERFANAWCAPAFNCVVLHVPGDPNGPWIVPGGSDIRKVPGESVKQELAKSSHQASLESTDPRKILAASTQAAEILRVRFGQGTYLAMRQMELRKQAYEKMARWARFKKVLMPVAAGGTALLLIVGALIIRWVANRRPREFPTSSRQIRLGAPYAGGNSATTTLTRQPSRR